MIECFLYFSSIDNRMEDSEEERSARRPHVTTGNTPHKPENKHKKIRRAVLRVDQHFFNVILSINAGTMSKYDLSLKLRV